MNVQQLWLAQANEAPRISLDYIRHRASSVEQGIRRRALLNYLVFAICIIVFCVVGWRLVSAAQPFLAAPIAYFAGAGAYAMYRLQRYVAQQASPADAGVVDTLRFHRRQLERQRDFRRWSWRWGVFACLLPGVALKSAALLLYSFPSLAVVESLVTVTLGSLLVIAISEYRARQCQREIDALDSLARDP